METININGVEYVKKDDITKLTVAEPVDCLTFCIIRTYSAGVHAGYVKDREGKYVTLVNAVRIWYWSGACSLSQLAVDGSADIEKCKYSVTVPEIILTEAIEIIPCTEKARKQIEEAKRWKK